MLGSIKSKEGWEWSAIGKHPAARDYIRLGANTPLGDAFAGWIENGYRRYRKRHADPSGLHSWRFWVKGMRRSHIACGLAKDSSDTLGRSYPLMLIGVGQVAGWEAHWEQLPTVLEDVWGQMEYLSAKRFDGLRQMEMALGRLAVASVAWSEAPVKRQDTRAQNQRAQRDPLAREVARAAASLRREQVLQIALDHQAGDSTMARVSTWNQHLRRQISDVPHTMFIGGRPEASFLVIYNRSLRAQDFISMWSL